MHVTRTARIGVGGWVMRVMPAVLVTVLLAPTGSRAATFYGPSPYLSFADSPFAGGSWEYFYLEDFEDGALNTPGVTASGGILGHPPPHSTNDSVDADDGSIDGFGWNGRSYYSDGAQSITFTFGPGLLPHCAGIVWTDIGFSDVVFGYGDIALEAFGPDGSSLGTLGPIFFGDGRCAGETGEDRFLGVYNPDGISALTVMKLGTGDWEVDHLQYGRSPSPPALVKAVSRLTHGIVPDVQDFDIDLPVGPAELAGVESRTGGPRSIVLTFDEPVSGAAVDLSAGTLESISTSGNEMTVQMRGVPDQTCLTLTISGLPGLVNPIQVHVKVLFGDVTGDGVVNIVDLSEIKRSLFKPVDGGNFRCDVHRDAIINIEDLSEVKKNLFHTAPVCIAAPPDMVLIPAGEFLMGDMVNEGSEQERPVHAVYVDAFYMDRTEVTNQQYADALNWALSQGGLIEVTSGVVYKYESGTSYPYCSTTSAPTRDPNYGEYSRITWSDSTFGVVSGKENHPMVLVSWYGAVAYANWRSAVQSKPLCYNLDTWECNRGSGYRLPTEAEWEKAARGGAAGRRFSWSDSDTIQHARANYSSDPYWPYDTSPTRGCHPAFSGGSMPYTSPVGYFAANGYGLYDMTGNVWEWCNDWWDRSYYSSSPYNNPRGPTSGDYRVHRGGSWGNHAWHGRVAFRGAYYPGSRYEHYGVRLALDAE